MGSCFHAESAQNFFVLLCEPNSHILRKGRDGLEVVRRDCSCGCAVLYFYFSNSFLVSFCVISVPQRSSCVVIEVDCWVYK